MGKKTGTGPPRPGEARGTPRTSEVSASRITVQVRLYATLRSLRPGLGLGEALAVEMNQGATIRDLIRQLALPPDEVKLVFVNGRTRDQEYVLADGDQLGIFPPVGGG